MQSKWLPQIVVGTRDAAFAVDPFGRISAWNKAAEELFGLESDEVVGRPSHEIVRGANDVGPFCSQHCSIHQAIQINQPVASFDLQIQTKAGRALCNVTIMIVPEPGSNARHAVHIVQPLDVHELIKKLSRLLTANEPTHSELGAPLISSQLEISDSNLTPRETETLRMLAQGAKTDHIATQLFISKPTVNNHVQHLLAKFDSHSRLEVVARAREAGMI